MPSCTVRDAVVHRALAVGQRRNAVNLDATAPAAAGPSRQDHVDVAGTRVPDAPVRRRRPVTQNGVAAAREHGRHPTALARQFGVADDVDAPVDAVEPLYPDAVLDLPERQSRSEQLRASHHAVLRARELCNSPVGMIRGAFPGHFDGKAPRTLISPPGRPADPARRGPAT